MSGRIFRYMCGFLRIRISGHSIERFINACSYRGIQLWEISPNMNYYEMCISIKDFKKLKPVIRKTRTKIMIVERAGFPFFIKNYKKRKLFFAGLIICVFIITFFSNSIWNIQIKGNSSYSTESVLDFLHSMDVETGMRIKNVNCNEISQKIRQNYDDVVWVSTSVNGSKLIIHIKENEDSRNITVNEYDNIPYDIIADDSYEITKIIIRNGIVYANVGDYVNKGDLLVSGQIPIYNDAKEIVKYQYCISDAVIYGKKNISYNDELNITTFEKKCHDTKKTEYYFNIGSTRFCFGSIKNRYKYFKQYSNQINKLKFSYGVRHVIPYKKIAKKYSENEIRNKLTADFKDYCQELEKKGVVILKNNVKIYTWSDKAKAAGTLTIEKPIGHKIKSELIETGDYIDGNDGNNN